MEGIYTPSQISIDHGATVIDVGANIGLFTLFLAGQYRDLTIHAVEPMYRTLRALESNTASLPNGCTCRILPVALGDGTASEGTLHALPNFAGNSTFHPETKVRQRDWMRESFDDNTLSQLYAEEQFAILLVTLPKLMHDESIESLDLLKIDVEGSELDVLRGVDPADWP